MGVTLIGRDRMISEPSPLRPLDVDWKLEQEQIFREQQIMAEEQKKCSVPPQPLDDAPPAPNPGGYKGEEPKKDVAAAVGLIGLLGKLFTYLNVKAWPLWAKCLAFVVVVPVLALVYKQQRIDSKGTPLFPDVHPGIVWFDDGSFLGKVQYPSGDSYARDGLAGFHVTWEEYQKLPAVLPAAKDGGSTWQPTDFPVVVWCNATGFDSTALPVTVRHAHNGALFYQKKTPAGTTVGLVRLLVPGPGNDEYTVYMADGTKVGMKETTWVTLYMNLPAQEPQPPPPPAPPAAPKVFTPEKK